MKESVNIICLYWEGEFRGRNFSTEDVARLYETVAKHIDRKFYFYVLSNIDPHTVPWRVIPLENDWPGWWSKMELHRSDLPVGRTLYLDLDTHVVSSLQPILDYPGELVMFPARSRGSSVWEGNRKQIHKYQAATMLFTPGSTAEFYKIFCNNAQWYMDNYRSEQDLMAECMPDLPTFPARWLTKLSELRKRELSKETIIITGQPKDTSFRDPKFATYLNQLAR